MLDGTHTHPRDELSLERRMIGRVLVFTKMVDKKKSNSRELCKRDGCGTEWLRKGLVPAERSSDDMPRFCSGPQCRSKFHMVVGTIKGGSRLRSLPLARSPSSQCQHISVGDDSAMYLLPVHSRPAARLAQQAQRRIAASQPQNLSARRATRQRRDLSRQPPAALRIPLCSQSFSTSSQLQALPKGSPSAPRPQPQPSQPDPPPRRRRPRWVSAAVFLLLGLTTGTAVRAVLAPPPPLLPGSEVDASLTRDIRAAADQLPVVKHLLADPEWSPGHHEAYAGIPAEARPQRITTGPLGGSRGVGGYQHVFHNGATGEVVAVVYLGTGTVGWPGVVHGGAIATLLDEHSARAALRDLAAGAGGGLLTANLDITYRRPTLSSDFYVLRARAVPEEALAPEERGKRGRKVWVDATVETVDGKVCVGCRALFVSPKSLTLRTVPENF